MPSQTYLRTLLLGVSLALTSYAWAQGAEGLAILQPKEKSTLETFPLAELEQEDLADAVIGDTLDAPAAGVAEDSDQASNFRLKELPPLEEYSDVHQYRTPTAINILHTPIPVGSRTYGHDYR